MISAMRITAAVTMLVTLTSAQGMLPACAQSCVTQFTSGSTIGGCGSLDIKCICGSKDFISGIACCLQSKCDPADQQSAIGYAGTFCAAAGVTVPTAINGLCTSTASSAASSTAPSASSSSAVAATTSSSGVSTTGGSSASSTAASVSSSASSVSSSVSSVAASVSSQASSASSSASAAAASTTKNASPHNVAGLGAGVVGGLVAAVALL